MNRGLLFLFTILFGLLGKSYGQAPVCCNFGQSTPQNFEIRWGGSSSSLDYRYNWGIVDCPEANLNPYDPLLNPLASPSYVKADTTLSSSDFCIESKFIIAPQCWLDPSGTDRLDSIQTQYTQLPFFFYGSSTGQYLQVDFADNLATLTQGQSATYPGAPRVVFKGTNTVNQTFAGWNRGFTTGQVGYYDVTGLFRLNPSITSFGPRTNHIVFCTNASTSYVSHTVFDASRVLTDFFYTFPTPFGAVSSITNGANTLYLGFDPRSGKSFMGLFDEVRIWSTMLTQTQIRNFRYAAFDQSNQPAGLQHYWKFDSSSSGSFPNEVTGGPAFTTVAGTSTVDLWKWDISTTPPLRFRFPDATQFGPDFNYYSLETPIRDYYVSVNLGSQISVPIKTASTSSVLAITGTPAVGTPSLTKSTTSANNDWALSYSATSRNLCGVTSDTVQFSVTGGNSTRYLRVNVVKQTPVFASSLVFPAIQGVSQSGVSTEGGLISFIVTNGGPDGALVNGESANIRFSFGNTAGTCSGPLVTGGNQNPADKTVSCTLPAGVGANNNLTVTICGGTYTYSFNYLPPVVDNNGITIVPGTPVQLLVSGRNFGANPSAITLLVGTPDLGYSPATVSTSNHTFLVIQAPSELDAIAIRRYFLQVRIAGQQIEAPISPGDTITSIKPVKQNNTTSIIIGSVVGGVLLLIIIILAILLIIYRRRKAQRTAPFTPVNKKDFTPVIFGSSNGPSSDDKKKAGNVKALEELLVQDDLKLAFVISDITQITEADTIAKAMVIVFEGHEKTLDLLKRFINVEVETTESAGTLFRSNSMVSKMFKFYSRLIGLPYLYTTIGPSLNQLIFEDRGLEVDPERMEEGADLDEMRWTLMMVSQQILKAILASVDKCPPQFRVLCKELKESVSKRFPADTVNKTIGGFIFLRFFCPAVTSPDSYGIVENPPSAKSRRLLILMTKVLQNLSNNVEFGSKELYMTKMNDFIQSNREKLNTFFGKLVTVPDSAASAPYAKLPKDVKEESLVIIGKHIQENLSKITDADLKKKLQEIVGADE